MTSHGEDQAWTAHEALRSVVGRGGPRVLGAQGGSTSRHDSMNVGVLLHHMETFGGMVVAITNRSDAYACPYPYACRCALSV